MRWAGLALVAGGLLMAGLWLVFTTVHGPTDLSDPIGGYRQYGFLAHLLLGLAWATLGVGVLAGRTSSKL